MGTLIGLLIAFAVGVATGLYRGRAARQDLERELYVERSFNGHTPKAPTEADVRKKVEKSGPVPSDPDVGDFLDHSTKTNRELRDEAIAAKQAAMKNEDGQALFGLIAKLGPDAWISATTINSELRWGFNRAKAALGYLERNRYIKKIDAKKNRGAQYDVKVNIEK